MSLDIDCTDSGLSAGKYAAVISLISVLGQIGGQVLMSVNISEDAFVEFHSVHGPIIKIIGEYLQMFAWLAAVLLGARGLFGLKKKD